MEREAEIVKARESGMPDESMWASFFDVPEILSKLQFNHTIQTAVEFGSGYGTFSIPASQLVSERLISLDIEPDLIKTLSQKAHDYCLPIQAICRDFVAEGTGLPSENVDYALLFNILHIEDPLQLLKEAWRVLKYGGKMGIIHWNHDPSTPRGPSMAIRPKPVDCIRWAKNSGFELISTVELKPYHYGLIFTKKK